MAQAKALDASLIDAMTTVVSQAAAAVLAARTGVLDPRIKADRSPVTAADVASEALILDAVPRLLPGVPIVSEEAAAKGVPANLGRDYLLVDPLDGTRELLAGSDEFAVNLALIAHGEPVFGIVAAPALGLIWRTGGTGAERLRLSPGAAAAMAVERVGIRTRALPTSGMVAAVSRSHFDRATDTFLRRFPNVTRIACGSAIKLCRVAEGAADIYPRLAPTSQWDIAAGHAIINAAGGVVTAADGGALTYRLDPGAMLIPGFIAWGDRTAATMAHC